MLQPNSDANFEVMTSKKEEIMTGFKHIKLPQKSTMLHMLCRGCPWLYHLFTAKRCCQYKKVLLHNDLNGG